MQRGKMHPDLMQWISCRVIECSEVHAVWRNGTLLNALDFMQHDWMQWIYAAWPKASWLNAVDSMQRHWMQRIPCIVAQWIPIVCSGVHAVRPNASRLNAVDSMQSGKMHPYWMQWIPCSVIECSGFQAAWRRNGTLLNAVDFMQHDWMQCTPCSEE